MRFLSLVLVFFLTSINTSFGQSNEEVERLKAPMRHLSSVVDSVVAFDADPKNISSEEILERAFIKRPGLRHWFEGYSLSVKVSGRDSSVLLCDKERKLALIEDTACGLGIERINNGAFEACTFTVQFEQLCKAP